MVDQRYLRPGFDFALAHAIEEAGEFLAAAGKTTRWGRQSVNPELPLASQETNEDWLVRELDDLRGALNRLSDAIADDKAHFDFLDGRMVVLSGWTRNNQATFLRLQLEATNDITEADVATWSDDQVQQADLWACSVHLSASDNDDIIVPPRPSFIPTVDRWAGRNPITGEQLA